LTPFTALQPHCSSCHPSVRSSYICSTIYVDLSRRRFPEMKWPDCRSCCTHASVRVRYARFIHASSIEDVIFAGGEGSAPVSSHIFISIAVYPSHCVIQPSSWKTILTAHVAARYYHTLQNWSCPCSSFFVPCKLSGIPFFVLVFS